MRFIYPSAALAVLLFASEVNAQTVLSYMAVVNPVQILSTTGYAAGGDLPIGSSNCPPGFGFDSVKGTCRHFASGTEIEGWEIVDLGSSGSAFAPRCGRGLVLTSFAACSCAQASMSYIYYSNNGTTWTYLQTLVDTWAGSTRVWWISNTYRYVLVARKWPMSSGPTPGWYNLHIYNDFSGSCF